MVTTESVKNGIEAGLACEHVEVIGDGQHFQAVIVSKEFEKPRYADSHVMCGLKRRARRAVGSDSNAVEARSWRAAKPRSRRPLRVTGRLRRARNSSLSGRIHASLNSNPFVVRSQDSAACVP